MKGVHTSNRLIYIFVFELDNILTNFTSVFTDWLMHFEVELFSSFLIKVVGKK